jgi:hypothetical protein
MRKPRLIILKRIVITTTPDTDLIGTREELTLAEFSSVVQVVVADTLKTVIRWYRHFIGGM